jgi:5-methylcytosine-specific restriction endonuclease McrA
MQPDFTLHPPGECACGAPEECVKVWSRDPDEGLSYAIRHIGPRIPRSDWRRYDALVRLYGERCGLCGATWRLVIDHVIPKAQGGRDRLDNLGLLCGPCNSSKGSKLIDDYRQRVPVALEPDPA